MRRIILKKKPKRLLLCKYKYLEKEIVGDIWDYVGKVQAIVIPVNGSLTSDKKGILDSGLALQAVKRYPILKRDVGLALDFKLRSAPVMRDPKTGTIFFHFVTTPRYRFSENGLKQAWHKKKPSLDLIKESANTLNYLIDIYQYTPILIPRVGCGAGGLSWNVVKSALIKTGLYNNPRVQFISR